MFEKASRAKLRFNYKGTVSVEDLWDLPLTALDDIYKDLNKQAKLQQEESLLKTRTAANTELDLKIEVLKHIVQTRVTEQEMREKAGERAAERKKILGIIAEKGEQSLRDMPVDKLKKMAEKLAD